MNIFVTDQCPIKSAKFLDNKRVIKMILESAQMLSTALILNNGPQIYRITHKNHPCTIWARTTQGNYKWLIQHFKALCDEYTLRYGKIHKCEQYYDTFINHIYLLPFGDLTDFVNCTSNYKNIDDIFKAYKLHLTDKWNNDKLKPKWG